MENKELIDAIADLPDALNKIVAHDATLKRVVDTLAVVSDKFKKLDNVASRYANESKETELGLSELQDQIKSAGEAINLLRKDMPELAKTQDKELTKLSKKVDSKYKEIEQTTKQLVSNLTETRERLVELQEVANKPVQLAEPTPQQEIEIVGGEGLSVSSRVDGNKKKILLKLKNPRANVNVVSKGGISSETQAQIDSKLTRYSYILNLESASETSPVPGASVHFGLAGISTQTAGAMSRSIPITGTIRAVYYNWWAATAGSNEGVTAALRVNNNTDLFVDYVATNGNTKTFSNTGMSWGVTAGDVIAGKMVYASSFGTTPANIRRGGYVVIETNNFI